MSRPVWHVVLLLPLLCTIPGFVAAQLVTTSPDSFTVRITEELRQVDPEAAGWFEQANAALLREDWETAAALYGKVRGAGSAFDTPILIQRVESSGCGGAITFQFLVVPAAGSLAVINGECSIATESLSWQRIKSLYRV